jgi:uncharacterized delta-60 repeat protein
MKKRSAGVLLTVAVLVLAAWPLPNALAAGGTLDTTFGTLGKVTTAIGSAGDVANAVAIQADGKIVTAGWSYNGTDDDFALARYNTNGSLDTTFDTDGKVTTAIGTSDDVALSVAIQSDGKIVAAGWSNNGTDRDFALARYNADGSLDATFDTDGKVTTAIGSASDGASAVAIQSDGKIVTAGWSYNGTNLDFALARYNTDGSLDTTFGTGGKVTTPIGVTDDQAEAVAIQSNGKIVAFGQTNNGTDWDFALARYNTNGSLDTTFDTDGKVVTPFGSGDDEAYGVAIQADGKIVTAGSYDNGTDWDFALARYNANGSLDTTFDTDGKVVTSFGPGYDIAYGVAIQADGKIVAAGTNGAGDSGFALARYKTNGTLDTTFDTDGKVTTAIGSVDEQAYSVAIQSDGKIVAVGLTNSGTDDDFALARYNSASPYQPDAQIRGGLASSYIGKNIYNLGGGGQTFGRQVRPGFSDQFNVKMQNDGNVIDRFFVHGEGGSTRFRITYFSGTTNVTGAVVAGTFQTPNVQPGSSRELKVVIFVRPGVSLGSIMTDQISVRSKGDPSARDVVGAKVLVSRNAGDLNSSRPVL